MQWSILDGYDRKFARVYVYSPTVHVDKETWDPVKAYCRRVLEIPEEEMGECFQDTFNEPHILRVLQDQERITTHQKRKKRPVFHVALYIDDFADEPAIARGQLLTSLFVKARHFFVSTFVKTQAFRLLGTSIRKNALSIFVWRLRGNELTTLLEELENTHPDGRRGVLRLYNLATAPKWGFLYVDVTAAPSEMFHASFKQLALTDG
jgi:hypothetical protein